MRPNGSAKANPKPAVHPWAVFPFTQQEGRWPGRNSSAANAEASGPWRPSRCRGRPALEGVRRETAEGHQASLLGTDCLSVDVRSIKMSSPFKNLQAPPTRKGTTYRGSRTTTDACHLNEKNIICKDETSTCGDLEKSTGKRRGVTTTAPVNCEEARNAALRREGSLAGAPEPGGAPRPGPTPSLSSCPRGLLLRAQLPLLGNGGHDYETTFLSGLWWGLTNIWKALKQHLRRRKHTEVFFNARGKEWSSLQVICSKQAVLMARRKRGHCQANEPAHTFLLTER